MKTSWPRLVQYNISVNYFWETFFFVLQQISYNNLDIKRPPWDDLGDVSDLGQHFDPLKSDSISSKVIIKQPYFYTFLQPFWFCVAHHTLHCFFFQILWNSRCHTYNMVTFGSHLKKKSSICVYIIWLKKFFSLVKKTPQIYFIHFVNCKCNRFMNNESI